MREKRRHSRFELAMPVSLRFRHQLVTGELHNLSRGGLFVRTALRIEVDLEEFVLVEFCVAPTKARCVAQGRVIRAEKAGFAVQFDELSDEFECFMNDLGLLQPGLRSDFLTNVLEPEIRVG
ncbi:PilZ domain-containing protein [Myxococcota bacterium]